MRLKMLMVTLIGSLLLLAPTAVSADQSWVGDPGKAWPVPNDAERGMHVQWFMDSFPGESTSSLVDNVLEKDRYQNPTCTSAEDTRCKSNNLQYSAVLPTCKKANDLYCVEEFGIISKDGNKNKAIYTRNFPTRTQNYFSGSTELKLPEASTGSLFSLPEATHGGGDLYYVSVFAEGMLNRSSGASLDRFSMRIFPVKLQPDSAINGEDEAGWSMEKNGGSGHPIGMWRGSGYGFSGNSFCVAGSAAEKLCAQRYAFPADLKFYVKTRLQNAPSGWLHGRIYNPDISLTGTSGNYSLEVSAFPVAVPIVYKMYRYPDMPQALKDKYDVTTGDFKPVAANYSKETINSIITVGGCGRSACTDNPLTRNKIVQPAPSDPYGMDQLPIWLPYVDDKASALLGTWSMRTLDWNEASGASQCFTNGTSGITGIVTTNATQYLAGPPKFNSAEQTLEYKVSAPHLTSKGETFYGSYDLLMRSDVARCVYGFSNAPIKGTISVTTAEGEQKVATESVKEAKGWVSLSANGFTYSAPTIRVKLSQDKPEPVKVEETTPVAAPAPNQEVQKVAKSSVASKKKSITCTNGKLTKKIVGANPKCPTGFKKK